MSNFVDMVVNTKLPVGVSIVADNTHVCMGTPVTFAATPLNGGSPGYQWYKNGLAVGENQQVYSCTPADGDQVYVEMTTSLTCVNAVSATSGILSINVDLPLEVSVEITSDQIEVCEGTPVIFTAHPVNGGLPVYQWFKNDVQVGNHEAQYSCIPVAGDRFHVEMTSSLACVNATKVTSNQLLPVVNLFPAAALAITGPSSVCAGSTGVLFTISPVSGAVSYTWNVPSGATIIGNEHESSILLNFGNSSNSLVISVYGNNQCGSGIVSPTLPVEVFPIPGIPLISREGNKLNSSIPSGNQWYFEGDLLTDSVGSSLTPKQAGWYWSVVTQNGCVSDTSNHILFDGVFPGPITSEPGFWVYPVPNDGHFTVAISLPSEDIFDITVYNSLGVQLFELPGIVVKSKFKRIIDLRPKVPKGLYVVIFKCNDYQVVKKVLIYNR
jgi:hypothetical protein